MKKNILITGCSSGLGQELTQRYLKEGYTVYGISRKKPKFKHKNFKFKSFDLSKTSNIKKSLKTYIKKIQNIDTVYLNAGILGRIDSMTKLSTKEIKKTLNINVFANKELLDLLSTIEVKNIIGISIYKPLFCDYPQRKWFYF